MPVIGIGVDLVEIERLAESTKEPRFLEKVFLPAESEYCQARRYPAQHLAARLAAKEAVMKALGRGWSEGIGWTQIEVRRTGDRPRICLSGQALERALELGVGSIHLSLTHTRRTAAAVVVLESPEQDGLPIRLRLAGS